jgi:hypothetical protein
VELEEIAHSTPSFRSLDTIIAASRLQPPDAFDSTEA